MTASPSQNPSTGLVERTRAMIAWSMIGQMVYILSQLAIIVVLARFGTVEDVGRFGLSTAIIGPVFFFFSLGLRFNMATDAGGDFGFATFLAVRMIGVVGGLATIAAIAALTIRDPLTLTILGLFALAKAVEMFSDLMYGVFQKHGKLRWVAESQIMRGLLSATVFTVIMVTTGSPGLAFLTFFGVWLTVFLVFDLPRAYRFEGRVQRIASPAEIWRLVWNSVPLGAAGFFANLSASTPRLILGNFAGLEQLGYFTTVAYFYQAANMVIQAINQAIIGRLARFWNNGNTRAFWSIMLKISAGLSALALVAVGIAIPFGGDILGLVFGENFRPYGVLLAIMAFALFLNIPAIVLQTGIMAQRRFLAQLVNRIIFAVLVGICCLVGVWMAGLNGVAIGFAVAAALQLPFVILLLRRASPPKTADA